MTKVEKDKKEFALWNAKMREATRLRFSLFKGDPQYLRDEMNYHARRAANQMEAMHKRIDPIIYK